MKDDRNRSIATRKSALALWQANASRDHLARLGFHTSIIGTETTGDKLQSKALAEERVIDRNERWHTSTGKGLFIKEVQDLIYQGQCDIAVHSLKDLPITRSEGLQLAGFLPAAPPEDVLILSPDIINVPSIKEFMESQKGGTITLGHPEFWKQLDQALLSSKSQTIGTTSRRRQALLRRVGLKNGNMQILRGNVDSRLQRISAGEFALILLAHAGLSRLSLFDSSQMIVLPVAIFTPACAQGVVALETRNDDKELSLALYNATDRNTILRIATERLILKLLGGDCHSTIGIHFEFPHAEGGKIHIFTAKGGDTDKNTKIPNWHHSETVLSEQPDIAKPLKQLESNLGRFSSFTEVFEEACSDSGLCNALITLLEKEGHVDDVEQ